MKLVVVGTGRRIPSLGDAVGDVPAGVGTLRGHQRGLAERFGLAFEEAENLDVVETRGTPTLLLMDHTFVTARLVRSLLRTVKGSTAPSRVALPRSRFVELYGQHQDLLMLPDGGAAYDAWWFPQGLPRGTTRDGLHGVPALTVPFREKIVTMPVPRNILGRPDFPHPLTTTVALHIKHWVHLLWLANLWPQIEMVDRITSSPLSTAFRLLRGLRPSVGGSKWAMARSFSYVGKDVDIHPTACVELSVLGDGCRIGPFALVRGSVLGKGVHVEERANVCYSTLGDGDFVSKNSTVVSCLGFPEADLCINGMQYCVAGRNSALTSLVRPMDMKYRADVTVRMDGRSVAIKELMVGSCFGHGSFVGPEVLIAPGREIPNGAIVAPRPGSVLGSVDPAAEAGGPVTVVDGVLKPIPGTR